MKNQKHKRKNKYTVLLVSDIGEKKTLKLHSLPRLFMFAGASLLVLFVALLIIILQQSYELSCRKNEISQLSCNLSAANYSNTILNAQLGALSANVVSLNSALDEKDTYVAVLEDNYNDACNELFSMYDPTGCPLTGTATVTDDLGEVFPENTIMFEAYQDADVISSGAGTVIEIDTEDPLGNLIVIDHGNGYLSYYYSVEEPEVSLNQKVNKGQVLFHINKATENVEYRLSLDDEFINPWDKLEIFG